MTICGERGEVDVKVSCQMPHGKVKRTATCWDEAGKSSVRREPLQGPRLISK